jgi:hypothetical protein
VVGFVAVSSFAVALILTDVAPPLSFFSLPSRAWELAIGALLAIWLGRRSQRHIPSVVSQTAGLVGLLLIVGSAILIDPQQPFPSLTALAPTIGAALVIVAGSGRTAVGALLSTALPRYLGRISYSLYLWHWPIITLIPLLIARDDLLTRLALAAASIAIAALSTRWIEERFRERTGDGRVRLSSPRVLGIAVGSSLGVAGVAIATAWTAMLLLPSSFTGSPSGPLPESAQAVISKPVVSGPLPLDLRPSILGSQDDLPDAYRDGCLRGALVTTAQPCFYGDEASAKTVLLFGDSKAVQWLPTLQRLAEDGDLRIVLLAKGGCTPADVGIWNDRLHRPSRECASWRDGAFAEIDRLQPDLVVMSSSPYYEIVTGSASTTVAESPDLWREGLLAALSRVSQAADEVVLLASSPRLPMSPTECFATQTDIADCEVPADAAVVELYERLELEAANASGARYATLNDVLCSETCPLVFDHFNVYRDVSHLTATFAEILADEVAREVGLVGRSDSETGEPRD